MKLWEETCRFTKANHTPNAILMLILISPNTPLTAEGQSAAFSLAGDHLPGSSDHLQCRIGQVLLQSALRRVN